ncbi:MAG: hypothetical protein JW900_12530 [Anaerolineae bacterium]|nr:hypothetical protein [Anaerolineae bacterium]
MMVTAVKQYKVYRNGQHADLQTHLQAALGDFYQRQRRLPAEVVVHPSMMDKALAALAALDLPRLPIVPCGGCLANEVWLGIPGERLAGRAVKD